MAGHATPDGSYRSGGHRDPIGIRGASRPASRGACPAPPGGRPGAFESAVSHTRPSAVAVLTQGVAAVEERAAAGSASHRRPLASRSVRSTLVAEFAAPGKTAHRFAGSRSESGAWPTKIVSGVRRASHGELLKLGIVVSERTVSRYLHGQPRTSSQTWRTFLANHLAQVADISELRHRTSRAMTS